MRWRFKGKLKSSVVQWALPDTPLRSYTKKSRWENCRKDLALRFTVVKKIYNQRFISQAILELFYLNSCIVEAKKAVREKMKETAQKRREEVVQVKRMKNPRACPHCPGFPLFQSGAEKDNHLISSHNYDYCKLCKVRLTTSPSSWISPPDRKNGTSQNGLFSVDRPKHERDASLCSVSCKTALPSLWVTVTNFWQD